MRRRGLLWTVTVASFLVLLSALSLQRVPSGHLGVGKAAARAAGLHLVAPWARLRVLPASGHLRSEGIALSTSEGSTFTFVLEADYRLRATLAPRLASDIRESGIEAGIGALATTALRSLQERTDLETVLSDRARVEAEVLAAAAVAGVALTDLRMTSDLGDAVVLRRRTEEARALVRPPVPRRVLVIGLDGADWETLDPLIRAGRLPNLARLVRDGSRSDLRSYDPMFSPLLWTTIATGKPPDEHGIADFLVKDKASGGKRPITSDYRKVKALWNVLGELDRSSSWFAWWASYPAESIVGTKVTEMLAYTLVRGGPEAAATRAHLAWPEDYLARHRELLVSPGALDLATVRRILPWLEEPELVRAKVRAATEEARPPGDKTPAEPVSFVLKLLSAAEAYHALALEQLRAGSPFVAVYYEGTDMMGHRFQHCLEPRMEQCPDEEFARYKDAIPAFLRYQDAQIGELLDAAGPGTITLLVSDHGFKSGARRPRDVLPYTTAMPAEWHRGWGVLLMHGPGVRQARLGATSIYDVAPTLLYVSGLPLAKDMPGRPVLEAFEAGVTKGRPTDRIPSYELVGTPLARERSVALDPEATAEMMANLRALGYVGGGGDESPGTDAPAGTDLSPDETTGETETQVFYHRNLATHHIKQGRLREAEAELMLANTRQPFPKTYLMLSEVRASQSRFADAAQAIRDGFDKVPDQMNPHSVLWMVEMDLRAGDAQKAEADARTYGPRATEGVRTAIEGRMQEARGQLPAAVTAYERALATEPLLTSVLLRLQALYRAAGQPDRIVPYLERGLTASDEADLYHNLLGEHARGKGEFEKALAHFQAAADSQPENGLYLGNLAGTLAALGRTAQARETLAWAERWDPREPQAWLAIAGAQDRLGNTEAALAAFRKAKERGAPEPAADAGTALVLARAGRREEARRVLSEALSRHPQDPTLRALAGRLTP